MATEKPAERKPKPASRKAARNGVTSGKAVSQKPTAKAAKKQVASPALGAGVMLSISQAAEEFGHDRRTITKRIGDLGLVPAGNKQGYPVYRLRDLLQLERKGATGEVDPDSLSPFERHAYFKAETERHKVNLERGELLQRDAVEREWARVLGIVAQELDVMVDEIERDIGPPVKVLEKIEEKADAIRERMYSGISTPVEEVPAEPVELDD